MAIAQSIWSLEDKKQLAKSSLVDENELESIIYSNIGILSDDWLVIGRQVHTIAGGYIDLLCMDRNGDTIVVELKKDLTPREVTAQTIDYASCISKYTPADLANIYLEKNNNAQSLGGAFEAKFGIKLEEENVNQKVRMVIVAAQMDASTERIIDYLSQFNIDINILFFTVFVHNGQRLLSRAWLHDEVISTPSNANKANTEWNDEYYVSFGHEEDGRRWEDAYKYGFICAGGGAWYTRTLHMLNIGDRIWVNIPHVGYVGVGEIVSDAMSVFDSKFDEDGVEKSFYDLSLKGKYIKSDDSEVGEQLVKVRWIKNVLQKNAIREIGFFGNQNTVCKPLSPKWNFTIKRLMEIWKIND